MTCQSCKHWIKKPPDPMNLNVTIGECRHSPPQMMTLITPNGVQISVTYPMLPPNFPACGQHQPHLNISQP